MIIRKMTLQDIPEVAAIEKECFSQPWSEKGFREGLENSAFFLVAEKEKVVGYIGMYVSVPEGEITNVAVDSGERGHGYGKKLVEAMQAWAAEHQITQIVLEVRSGNDIAIQTYQSRGFVKIGVRKNFYRLPCEDADIMEWNLC